MTIKQGRNPQTIHLLSEYLEVRRQSQSLVAGLSDADATVQSMPDASPAKWHLAHTTWFFETLILLPENGDDRAFDPAYAFLFNSYYESLGARHPRPHRGMLTRPSLADVLAYRDHVDTGIEKLLRGGVSQAVEDLVTLGIHHEQQHQELLLTDILHLFAQNPLRPAYKAPEPLAYGAPDAPEEDWFAYEGGLIEIGDAGNGFAFDSEGPRHEILVRPYRLAPRTVTNGEWIAFMEDGGYADPLLWLSDGWAWAQAEGWQAPNYWRRQEGEWHAMTLRGFQPIDARTPVCHISYFEADAYARWAGKRLPGEAEWENAAATLAPEGNFAPSGRLRPAVAAAQSNQIAQMFGDVWEWTRSPFVAYPGFKPEAGAVGEYNGKFMSGQYVLRGGSCVTPGKHIRATYRNFFQPEKRWQFSGLRLAEDC